MSAATSLGVIRIAWRYPEWWSLALAAGAWMLMIRGQGHHIHAHGPATAIGNWMLMTVAMMLPMVSEQVRLTAERSLWRRRHRAMAGFIAGYLGCWALVGAAVSLIPVHPGARTAAIAFAVAGAWQLTRWKRRALVACHRAVPLAPRGWRADVSCMRFGWSNGRSCVISCWALMLACAMAGHALTAMAFLTTVGLAERYVVRDQRLLAGALFAAAGLYLLPI